MLFFHRSQEGRVKNQIFACSLIFFIPSSLKGRLNPFSVTVGGKEE